MSSEDEKLDVWPSIIDSRQFSRHWLETEFFPTALQMKAVFERGGCNLLAGKRMVVLFYEPSTRTRYFFQMAMEYMGGRVVFATENAREFSSAKKGETLKDTILVVSRARPDVLVLRYDQEGGAVVAANASSAMVINAGDGPGQHPTQALLDIFTIRQEMGQIDGLRIAMVGDLINGRTVRSLCYLLGKFDGIKIYLVSPKSAQMKQDVKDYLKKHNVAFEETNDLREVAGYAHVVYQTRTQVERGTTVSDVEDFHCAVNKGITMSMRQQAIIMHPLPRVDEISPAVDSDFRAVYLTTQLDSSMYTKMALLKMGLAPNAVID